MKTLKLIALTALMMMGTSIVNAQENVNPKSEDIIKIDANSVPLNYVNKSFEELQAGFKDLEAILETENFQLYQAGDYSFKVENGIVVSQSIQFEDANDDKVLYNKILEALQKTKFIKDTHNTGGNYYQYADFQIQFDDFQGYQKLTYSVIPADFDLTEK